MAAQVSVKTFLDKDSNTFTYVVTDPGSKESAVIDSVLDFDLAGASTSTILADNLIAYVKEQGLKV
jgi:glyoxylase-like metal-dependent hydrolase (beta-lactamase superfamily II)